MDPNHVCIASIVATYWFVSISMVYLNKCLLSEESFSIAAPLFITWFQCIITASICYVAGFVGEKARFHQTIAQRNQKNESVSSSGGSSSSSDISLSSLGSSSKVLEFFTQFPKMDYNPDVAKRVLPLSVVFLAMITFNNLCLKLVEVSFYTVARSLTIVFNVILNSALLGAPTSARVMKCLGVVLLGFCIGAEGEVKFSMKGTAAGVCSSAFVSLNSIYTKQILPAVEDDHWRLVFYNNANASIMFIPLMLLYERSIIWTAMDAQLLSPIFWFFMFIAGFLGFSIGIVTVLQIKATSPLMHNISGTAKAVVQSLLAFYLWGNEATWLGIFGIFSVLGGNLWCTVVKMRESGAKPFVFSSPPINIDEDNSNNNDKNINNDNEEEELDVEMSEIRPMIAKV